ncbi:hypothetical protein [Massilia sp. CF038]|uniref:hypothetical protein n=1 Tax=Massilia sp. CF038 TaxID=1881045 RepID=UPI000918C14A|nr:hypothetical protein [Massilia sp. CF038]SHG47042.1 hypothetical protein SAMN05428948_0624 [Massilia sp. CF038]
MSKLLHTLVISPDQVQGPAHGMPIGRPDSLTSQHIEVGIVLRDMLGEACAADYLARHEVAPTVARRVLSEPARRRGNHAATPDLASDGEDDSSTHH